MNAPLLDAAGGGGDPAAASALDREISRVVAAGNCSGCGLCTRLDSGLEMRLDDDGFARPQRTGTGETAADAVRTFRAACPGVTVSAQRPEGSTRHPTMGPVVQAWAGWAADPEIRHRGSSGGVLTALAAWLVATGEAPAVIAAAASETQPRRTVSITLTTRAQALAAAGSRYGPVSNAAAQQSAPAPGAIIGKPCEVSALRAAQSRPQGAADPNVATPAAAPPLLLSFFCAGTPSQLATDALAAELGVARESPVRELWYRGRGWPGRFTVVPESGQSVSTSYDESWGQHLGRAVQWRCKICPDGVGESADVSAADLWDADERGYPSFEEGEGVSAIVARTRRGHELVLRAIEAGILVVRPLDIERLAAVQPLQNDRRQTLVGRLLGTRLAGGSVPRYRGFSLWRLAAPRWRETLRVARGSWRRRRGARPR